MFCPDSRQRLCRWPAIRRVHYFFKTKMAHPAGFEPATIRLEGGCSIQLSYGRMLEFEPKQALKKWSEWRDSNPRHSAPKADALPGCATLRVKPVLRFKRCA